MGTTRDSFDESKNYLQVVVQNQGKPHLDFEKNEQSKILVNEASQATKSSSANHRHSATRFESSRYITGQAGSSSEGPEWVVMPDLTLTKGSLWVDGVRVILNSDVNLAEHVTLPTSEVNDFAIIFARISLTEVDSAEDPSIATPEFGETTRRLKPSVVWDSVWSTVSLDDALSKIPAVNDVAGANFFTGATMTVVLAGLVVPPASEGEPMLVRSFTEALTGETSTSPLLLWDQLSRWYPISGGESVWSIDSVGSFVVWNAAKGRLTIGYQAPLAGEPLSLYAKSPVMFSPLLRISQPLKPAGAIHGQDWTTGGLEIPNGYAVGIVPLFGLSASRRSGSVAESEYVNGLSVYPTTNKLHVGPLSDFTSPGSFILVSRFGLDLHWRTGKTTRGTTSGTVTDTPLNSAGRSDDVVLDGQRSDIGGRNGLALALAYNRADDDTEGYRLKKVVTGDWCGKSFRLRVRQGIWNLSPAPSLPFRVGRFDELAYTSGRFPVSGVPGFSRANTYTGYSKINIRGDGRFVSKVEVSNPTAATYSDVPGLIILSADEVELRDLTFENVLSGPPAKLFPTLVVFASKVTIRDCQFIGHVRIYAEEVDVSNTLFESMRAQSGVTTGLADFDAPSPETVAGCLRLVSLSSGSDRSSWKIKDCSFKNNGVNTLGLLVLDRQSTSVGERGKILVDDCHFDCGGEVLQARWSPAIGINNEQSKIKIKDCSFTNLEAHPLTLTSEFSAVSSGANTLGDPVSTVKNGLFDFYMPYTWSYVSLISSRRRGSRLSIRRNEFDLKKVGNNSDNPRGAGAFLAISGNPMEPAGPVEIRNVDFSDNQLEVGSSATWHSARRSWVWGAYLAPSVRWRGKITSYLLENVNFDNNTFDTGFGERGWRGMGGWHAGVANTEPDFTRTIPSGGIFYHGSCLLGFALQNPTAYGLSNRMAHSVRFDGNKFGSINEPDSWQPGQSPRAFDVNPSSTTWFPTHITPISASMTCGAGGVGFAWNIPISGYVPANQWPVVSNGSTGGVSGRGAGSGVLGVTFSNNEFYMDVSSTMPTAWTAAQSNLTAMIYALDAGPVRSSGNVWRYMKPGEEAARRGSLILTGLFGLTVLQQAPGYSVLLGDVSPNLVGLTPGSMEDIGGSLTAFAHTYVSVGCQGRLDHYYPSDNVSSFGILSSTTLAEGPSGNFINVKV